MPTNYNELYFPVLTQILFAALVAGGLVFAGLFLGKRRRNAAKDSPYESGMKPVGSARERFSVKFYLVAMLFIVFDIETVFMIPWGVHYRQLSCQVPLLNGVCPAGQLSFFGLGEMLVFAAILVVGFIYVWKKGALTWD
jgi:NADH-quinone oxidoreductase subunit A